MKGDSLGRVVKTRVYATSLGGIGDEFVINYNNAYTEFSSVDSNGNPSFRMKGRVELTQPTVGFHTNYIELFIYNLGANSRALFQSKVGTKIEIYAGYGGDAKQITIGNIFWANTTKEGTDYITRIVAGDSLLASANGDIKISFKGPVTFQQIIDAGITNLRPMGIFLAVSRGIPEGGYNNGFTYSGNPFKMMHDICDNIGCTFTVLSGGIYILPINQDSGKLAIEISVDTGMIGMPEIQPVGLLGVVPAIKPPTASDVDITFTHLLRADLILGQRVTIKSKFVHGDYSVLTTKHEFDSWTGPFYTTCQGRKLIKQGSSSVSG